MISIANIQRDIERIEQRYNAENDTIPGAPVVTWTDMALLDLIKIMAKQMKDLQQQIREIPEEEQAGKSYAEYYYGIKRGES